MKRLGLLLLLITLTFTLATPIHAQGVLDRMKQAAKDKVNNKVDDKTNQGMDSAIDKADQSATNAVTPKKTDTSEAAATTPAAPAADPPQPQSAATPAAIKAYQNYDFTPGDTILFADDFTTTQDGEFPSQWELVKGQGVVNKQQGYPTFVLTDGNYVQVNPRVKNKSYLGGQFTVEYDTFFVPGSYPLQVFFEDGNSNEAYVAAGNASVDYTNGADSYTLGASLPAAIAEDKYANQWHHIALAVKNRQLKVYVDQYRVLVVPDMHMVPISIMMGGLASQEAPLIFHTMRVASGGGMNMLGQKFTDAKIVTHGINFDTDKATLRPESMGTLNQIKQVLTENPDLKFEIDGHTDNSGMAAHNLTLSQQRADAVKAQLVSMGISAARLTTKGFGDTKPTADNGTPEGKANNRRVEFVRVS